MAETCAIEGCENPAKTRGWCPKHYVRWKVHGDPTVTLPVGRKPGPPPPPCSSPGCVAPVKCKGLCSRHYQRLLAHGATDVVLNNRGRSALERFMDKVEVAPNGCWIWVGTVTRKGYGALRVGRKMVSAHVWAYRHFVGPIEGLEQVDHLCHSRGACSGGDGCPHRRCCNPAHLELVDNRENAKRGIEARRRAG